MHNKCPICKKDLHSSYFLHTALCLVYLARWCCVTWVGCMKQVELQHLRAHVAECPHNPHTPSTPLTASTTFTDLLTASPSKLRGNVCDTGLAHFVRGAHAHGGQYRSQSQYFEEKTITSQKNSKKLCVAALLERQHNSLPL
eukprot:scpid64061/ scgid5893/ 